MRTATDPTLLILLSLADGPRHGYGLIQDIEGFAGKRLGAGTLYGAISRLEENGLIVAVPTDEPRRQPYQLTRDGERALDAGLADVHRLSDVGRARRRLRVAGGLT